jgi:hypothetical protein
MTCTRGSSIGFETRPVNLVLSDVLLCHYLCAIAGVMQPINVFPVPFLTKHDAMKAYWESGSIAPRIP